MDEKINKTGIKACIFMGSMFFMCYVGLSGAIADIAAYFPTYSVQVIQTGMMAITLVSIPGAFIAGRLAFFHSKRTLVVVGFALVAAGGVGGFFFHDTIVLYYVWSCVIGAGMGFFQPLVVSFITDYFEGKERDQLAGLQTSFVSGGSVLLTFLGGLLAVVAWHFSYLVFLIAVPVLITCLINLPAKNRYAVEKAAKQKIPRKVSYYIISVFLFFLVYITFPSNIALYLSEKGFGSAALAGGANAVFMIGGVVMGLFFSGFNRRFGEYLFGFSHLILTVSLMLLCFGNSIAIVFIAVFVGGMGIGMTMPRAVLSLSAIIPPAAAATVFSFHATVAPSLAGFISPTVFAFLGGFVSDAGDSVSRLTAAAVMSAVLMVAQFIITAKTKKIESI